MHEFKYPIFPDRKYTLQYEDMTYEVFGSEILAMFRRTALLEKMFNE